MHCQLFCSLFQWLYVEISHNVAGVYDIDKGIGVLLTDAFLHLFHIAVGEDGVEKILFLGRVGTEAL